MADVENDVEDFFNAELFVDTSYMLKVVPVNSDIQIKLYALHNAATTDHDLTGQIVWPAAKVLSEFLIWRQDLCCGSVLELGAGAGLAGLVAAMLSRDPSSVILTDNNSRVLELLQSNIDANFAASQARPRCCHLSWGRDEAEKFAAVNGSFDVLLGADVVFWPAAIPLLFETVSHFLRQNPKAQFVLSYTNRCNYSTGLLFDTARQHQLVWTRYVYTDNTFSDIQQTDSGSDSNLGVSNILVFTAHLTDVLDQPLFTTTNKTE